MNEFFSAVSVSNEFRGKKPPVHWSITCGLDPIPFSCPVLPSTSSSSCLTCPAFAVSKDRATREGQQGAVRSRDRPGQNEEAGDLQQDAASPTTMQWLRRWPVACLLLHPAGSRLASTNCLPPPAGVWGFGHTLTHTRSLTPACSTSPCSPCTPMLSSALCDWK